MAGTTGQSDLLEAVLKAHGGLERFNQINSIRLTFTFHGAVLALRGYHGHYRPTITIDTKKQYSTVRGFLGSPDSTYIFTPQRTWTERADGSVTESTENPREYFSDQTHSTDIIERKYNYFVGYALHNYLTIPFCFTSPGVKTRELEEHHERGEVWRVLEVTFPEDFEAHCKLQRFYFSKTFMLQRMDYRVDIFGGDGPAHYCFDHKEIGGIIFPTLRRVVSRDPETNIPGISGPSIFVLDYIDLSIDDK